MAEITYTKTFNAELASLSDELIGAVAKVLDDLKRGPDTRPKGLVKLTSLDSAYRARVGHYRIIFSRSNAAWKALCIRHRSRVYKSLGPSVLEGKEALEDPFDDQDESGAVESKASPFPITVEDLERWRIPVAHRQKLVGCASEDDLLKLSSLPYEVFSRVVDLLYPSDFERLDRAPGYVLPPLDALKEGWKENLFGFILHLDEEQRRLAELNVATQEEVRKLGRPILVKGGPGSGKSTVALYRVRKIVETFEGSLFDPPSVLLLTYTNALTNANKALLTELMGALPPYVQVRTLDSVAREIVHACEKVGEILSEKDKNTHFLLNKAKGAAGELEPIARLTDQYLIDEIFQVIEGQGIKTRKDYLAADRRGRKARLSEAQRKAVWRLYEAFLEVLGDTYRTWEDVRWVAYHRIKSGSYPLKFDHVIVDEAQDLSPNALRLAVELCRHPGGLYLTADADQSLYQNSFSWQRIHEDLKFGGKNVHVLLKNYRNTKQVTEASRAFLMANSSEADMDQADWIEGGESGPRPRVVYTTPDTEIAKIKQAIRDAVKCHKQPLSNVAILVAGDQKQASERGKAIARELSASQVRARYMSSSDLRLDADCVKVLSLHTSKGLEFPIVLVVDVHDGVLPRNVAHLPVEERLQERDKDVRLLYVGMSRAMKDLTLFAREGLASEFVHGLDEEFWELPR